MIKIFIPRFLIHTRGAGRTDRGRASIQRDGIRGSRSRRRELDMASGGIRVLIQKKPRGWKTNLRKTRGKKNSTTDAEFIGSRIIGKELEKLGSMRGLAVAWGADEEGAGGDFP